MNTTAAMARSITWGSSKQAYLTARLLADRDLVDDCLRAYAYFRWADDSIDIRLQSGEERLEFIERQKSIIEQLYQGERPTDLCPEERMLADLIAHDRGPDSGLHSFIHNFTAVIAFDATRHGRLISRSELDIYSTCLASAVMDGMQYFIGNGHPYPRTPERSLAVTGAHLTHMLRDMLEDLPVGIINLPAEDMQTYSIHAMDVESESFRGWVRVQTELARTCLREGRLYIDSLDVLRCKLAGIWYCARFERVLQAIENDNYRLRDKYPERHSLAAWAEMAALGIAVLLKHYTGRIRQGLPHLSPRTTLDAEATLPAYHLK